jgi:hypothetical protein
MENEYTYNDFLNGNVMLKHKMLPINPEEPAICTYDWMEKYWTGEYKRHSIKHATYTNNDPDNSSLLPKLPIVLVEHRSDLWDGDTVFWCRKSC